MNPLTKSTRHRLRRDCVRALCASIALGAISVVAQSPLCSVAYAQDKAAQSTMEAAQTSRLVPELSFPSGAFRSTSQAEIEKFSTALAKFTKEAGIEAEDRPAPTKVEVVIWKTDSDSVRKQIAKALDGQDYQRYVESEVKKDGASIIAFSSIHANPEKETIAGMWVTQSGYQLLVWGALPPRPAASENSVAGIFAGAVNRPYVVTPPRPAPDPEPSASENNEAEPTKSAPASGGAKSSASVPGAQVVTLTAEQNSVNVMKNAMLPLPTFARLAVKPGFVRGYVKNAKGKPIAGAVIGVRSSSAGGFTSGATGKSDANGYYEIQAPWGAAEFYAASVTLDYGENRAAFGLYPSDGETDGFATAKGCVKNWVLLPYGIGDRDKASEQPEYRGNYFGGTLALSWSVADPRFSDGVSLPDNSEIEFRMTPSSPLIGGAGASKPLIIRRPVRESGRSSFFINNVPVCEYKIAAYINQGGKSTPLKMRETGPMSGRTFGLSPKEGVEGVTMTFRPNTVKAGQTPASHGDWEALTITLYP